MTLVWTYNPDINSEVYPSYDEDLRITAYINYYRLSIHSASKLGYKCVIYTLASHSKYFEDLNVEIIPIPQTTSKIFDVLKLRVLEEREGEFILIDGDLILSKSLPISNKQVLYEHNEIKSWSVFYSRCVDNLTEKGIGKFIPEWKGEKRNFVANCGLLRINDLEFKNIYIERWNTLNKFIEENILEEHIVEYSATAAQYLLTELLHYHEIDFAPYREICSTETYVHYYGSQKFDKRIVPNSNLINFNKTQAI